MNNWSLLEQKQYDDAWNFVYDVLQFRPRVGSELLHLPQPNIVFTIEEYYDAGFREDYYSDLHVKIHKIFQLLTRQGERIIALNWQHDCYSFDPRIEFERDEFDEWLIPVFPNGDYIFFLKEDYSNGVFGDGLHLSLSFYGKELVEALSVHKPIILIDADAKAE